MNYLGLIGLLGLTGEADGPPVQSAGQIADLGGGALMAAFGILAALRERERSGEGQLVDVSMADGALSWLAMVAGALPLRRQVPRRGDSMLAGGMSSVTGPTSAPTAGSRSARWSRSSGRRFCDGVGREDLIEHQFEPPGSRRARARSRRSSRERTRAEWTAFTDEHDCCLEPVLDLDEALDSELVRAREMVVELEQPGLGSRSASSASRSSSRARPATRRRPGAGARRAHRRGAARGRLLATRRSRR